jgi:predicted dehydrogenase
MPPSSRTTRRTFVKAAAITGAAASTLSVPSLLRAGPPSEQLNVGLIGVGIRGFALHKGINESQHARVGGIVDLCDHYVERIRPELANPDTPISRDYRTLLDRKDLDAVVIASPDFWHAQMTLDALDAGKDVYVEKPMTHSFDEAICVRDKAAATGRVTQVGYQRRTLDHFQKARQIVQSGVLGQITQIQLWSSRNRPTPPWRAYDDYNTPGLPKMSGPEHVDWARFQANRSPRPYDPRRFFHWQCYDEYSTGIFGILMSHPLDAANLLLDLDVPESCSAAGGIFKYDDGRTVPDTCSALLNYPKRKLTISFIGSSNNGFFDREAQYRGTEGTLELGVKWLRIYAEKKNDLFDEYVSADQAGEFTDLFREPIHKEPVDYDWSTIGHLDDFFTAVKSRGRPKAPVQECFKAMVAVAMAIESYQTGRTVRFDAAGEKLVT